MKELMNLMRQFRLGESLFRSNVQISKYELVRYNYPEQEVEAKIKYDLIHRFAKELVNKFNSSVVRHERSDSDHIEYELELLILKPQEFKTIVESAIQMLPDDKIKEIKEGKPL